MSLSVAMIQLPDNLLYGLVLSWSPEGSSFYSANSCNVAGTSCIGSCLSIGPFHQRGEGGFAAWVTAYRPYYFTQASCSGEDTSRYRACYHSLLRLKDTYDE